jgi:acyl-CoA thioesterase-1
MFISKFQLKSLTRFSNFSLLYTFILLWGLLGCDPQKGSLPPENPQDQNVIQSSKPTDVVTTKSVSSGFPRIVAFGNSLTAGLGVSPDQSYPAQLQQRLNRAGYHYRVINAGVSGDTTTGGLRRVDWVLKSHPSIVIVELGANDGLRGQPLATIHSNLDAIISRLQNANTVVVLAGMKIPPNYGLHYTTGFSSMFKELAQKHQIALIPFLLEGVAAQPSLNQADGLHPTATGYEIVADTVMAALKPLLREQGQF